MTILQWAICATLHQQPDYRFTGNERRAAERMVKKKWLRPLGGHRYRLTVAGERTYKVST